MNTSKLIFPFLCWWTFGLFLVFCCSVCGHEHSCPCLLCPCAGVSLWYIAGGEVEYGNGKLPKITPKWLTSLHFHQQCMRVPTDPHLPRPLVLSDLIFAGRIILCGIGLVIFPSLLVRLSVSLYVYICHSGSLVCGVVVANCAYFPFMLLVLTDM